MTLNIQIKASCEYESNPNSKFTDTWDKRYKSVWTITVIQQETGRGRVCGTGKDEDYEKSLIQACEEIHRKETEKLNKDSKALVDACLSVAKLKPTKLILRDA